MKNYRVLLSICIAVYNHDKYIIECLESIKKYELFSNTEIIIINDASTDKTDEKIKERINLGN
jgi:glycosyltransferase involved in cell wall biosynthesis